MRLAQAQERERREDQPDRHVEPEDPLPRDPFDDRAADQRSHRDRQAPDPAPGAEREPASFRRHGRGEDRQRERGHDRAADSLRRAGQVEREHAPGEGGRGGREREDAEADREHQPPAEPVAERRPGQEQHCERQRVGVHRPLELGQRGVQVLADDRQRRGHDEVVERDHEERDRGDRERPDRVASCAHLSLRSS